MNKVINQSGHFRGYKGTVLYQNLWLPQRPEDCWAQLILIHGYAEHSGRYHHFGTYFASRGVAVGAFDLRAHGNSEGSHTFFTSIDECVEDLKEFIQQFDRKYPTPLFLLGHSMGGLIACSYGIELGQDSTIKGIMLSGPALQSNISPFLTRISGFLARLMPQLKTIKLDANSVSRDPKVVENYNTDPLNYRGGIPAATGAAINRAMVHARKRAADFHLPVRIMFGTADRLAHPQGSRDFFSAISSQDKSLFPYENLYHEILNEPEREIIFQECLQWMKQRYQIHDDAVQSSSREQE